MKNKTVIKPWGKYVILEKKPGYWIKKLFVRKGSRISLQSHRGRMEIWIVLSGAVTVVKGNLRRTLTVGKSLKINKKEKHRITGITNACVLEVSFGRILERDIIRYKDDYGRA